MSRDIVANSLQPAKHFLEILALIIFFPYFGCEGIEQSFLGTLFSLFSSTFKVLPSNLSASLDVE